MDFVKPVGDASSGGRRFRTSFTKTAGEEDVKIFQATVIAVNEKNWTVDVFSKYDRHRLCDVQVMSPYIHHNSGEGASAMPEINATAVVCVPGDSSPPFVLGYVMAFERISDASEDAPAGSMPMGMPSPSGVTASFAGGREQQRGGDLVWTTRDGNFIKLLRGGVLQLGSTELSQRLYVPLTNSVIDISENYAHHNSMGSILWGIQEGPKLEKIPGEFTQCFRIIANDKSAWIRVKIGKVKDPIGEPLKEGYKTEHDKLEIGKEQILYEVSVVPEGFDPHTGNTVNATTARETSVIRIFIDKKGGVAFRSKWNVFLASRKTFKLRAEEQLVLESAKDISIKADAGVVIDGGTHVHIKGGVVRIGGGKTPVATQGGIVQVVFPFTPSLASPTPMTLTGFILNGVPSLLG